MSEYFGWDFTQSRSWVL